MTLDDFITKLQIARIVIGKDIAISAMFETNISDINVEEISNQLYKNEEDNDDDEDYAMTLDRLIHVMTITRDVVGKNILIRGQVAMNLTPDEAEEIEHHVAMLDLDRVFDLDVPAKTHQVASNYFH